MKELGMCQGMRLGWSHTAFSWFIVIDSYWNSTEVASSPINNSQYHSLIVLFGHACNFITTLMFCEKYMYVWLFHVYDCRPVKVIRLVGRHSVEEIVLKRAHRKLELTNTVIEGGQVCSEETYAFSCIHVHLDLSYIHVRSFLMALHHHHHLEQLPLLRTPHSWPTYSSLGWTISYRVKRGTYMYRFFSRNFLKRGKMDR